MTEGQRIASGWRDFLRRRLDREPTHQEIAKEMGLPKSAIDYLLVGRPT